MTTLTLRSRAISHTLKAIVLPAVNWKLVYGVSALLFVMALVVYISLINQLTQGAFLIKDYDRQIDKLVDQNKTLETKFAESGFLGNVQQKAASLNFEKTTKVAYVQISNGSLGMAK